MGNAGTLVGRVVGPAELGHRHPGDQDGRCRIVSRRAGSRPAAAIAESGMFSSMPAAGMLGSAIGAGAPTVVADAAFAAASPRSKTSRTNNHRSN